MPARIHYKTNVRVRSKQDPNYPNVPTPAVITNITATAADTIQLTFNGRVTPSRVPGFTAGAGGGGGGGGEEHVESINAISDTVIELTFSGDVQGTDLIVQGGDPGIRTVAGGTVPAGTYAIPTFP